MSDVIVAMRAELDAMRAIVDALEPVRSDAQRMRLLAAVAVMFKIDDVALNAIAAAKRLETETP